MTVDFYLYAFLVFMWGVYILNSHYQNRKLKDSGLHKRIELLTVPFYIFYVMAIYSILQKLTQATVYAGGEIGNYNFYLKFLIILGSISCFISALLYTYISIFEKSFPSCLAMKNDQQLKGLYCYVRHPSYYIFLFITFGSALCLLNTWLLILAVVNHVCLYFYYIDEENKIAKTNTCYKEYLRKTHRFWPSVQKLQAK